MPQALTWSLYLVEVYVFNPHLQTHLTLQIRVSALDPVQAESAVSLLDQYNSYVSLFSPV